MSLQKQYDYYRSQGMTHAGALGMLGNGSEESNNISYRKQGDFSSGYAISRTYTAQVDNGTISRSAFCNGVTGYGLYQWTYPPRQQWLYDAAKRDGCSIGDENFQLRFSVWELKNHFAGVWSLLTTSNDIYTCVRKVCEVYENPAIWNTDARYQAALRIEKELSQKSDPTPEPPPTPTPAVEVYWPPRMVDKSMNGPDVFVLQSILTARGYSILTINGIFDDSTEKAVRKFQAEKGLVADGVVGPMTWRALLAYGS